MRIRAFVLIVVSVVSCLVTSVGAEETVWDLYSDTWVATDDLGRALPVAGECRAARADRFVGIFYLVWHGHHNPRGPFNVEEILAKDPDAIKKSTSPPWGPVGAFHHWAEPEFGYYLSDDPYIIRKHCEMLVDAGVDTLILDVTNEHPYTETYRRLCRIFREIRKTGGRTPQICFFGRVKMMQQIHREFYAKNAYRELWFEWQGKPIWLLSCPRHTKDDPKPSDELKKFFTIRPTWGWTFAEWFGDGQDRWSWIDFHPQKAGWHTKGKPEQLSVSGGVQANYMSMDSAHGRHFHDGKQPPPEEWTGEGNHFAEQWEHALKIDPEFVFVTAWNEWVAQRFISDGSYVEKGWSFFVDDYNQEFSRDLEPMKGGHSDNYYYQLIDYVRRYKGVRPSPPASKPKTIVVDGQFDDWADVLPEYRDWVGDTYHRDFDGWGEAGPYVNKTGRNDIKLAKVARDAENVCFYATTVRPMTKPDGLNWMLLFVDADNDHTTGWQGYDYLVNRSVVDAKTTTLSKWTADGWVERGQLAYRVAGNELEIVVPRDAIGLAGRDAFTIDFHWADNIQKLGDIVEFGINGDSAPNRRFNYRYSCSSVK